MPIRVLLVEPDVDTRELYALCLSFDGWDVVEAHDWASAQRAFTATAPAVVVMETRLPDLSDLTPLARFSADGAPVIALTTTPRHQHQRIRAAGVDRVLMKPCLWETVAAEIRSVLTVG